MRGWVKWVLFFNSYTPFFLILLLRDRGRTPWLGMLAAGLIVLSNLILAVLLSRAARVNVDRSGTLLSRESKTGDALNYTVTYIIPFLEFDLTEDLLPLVVLMAVVGVLYVNSNLLYTNPMLSAFGYRVFEVTVERSKGEPADKFLLLTRRRPPPPLGGTLRAVFLTDELYREVS
jgi:hypothetical protein